MAFPAFAQQLYAFPIDATGKAVCANCHLAEAPIRLSGPSAAFPNEIMSLGQLSPDGSPSNNGGFQSPCNGWLGRVHISRESMISHAQPSYGLSASQMREFKVGARRRTRKWPLDRVFLAEHPAGTIFQPFEVVAEALEVYNLTKLAGYDCVYRPADVAEVAVCILRLDEDPRAKSRFGGLGVYITGGTRWVSPDLRDRLLDLAIRSGGEAFIIVQSWANEAFFKLTLKTGCVRPTPQLSFEMPFGRTNFMFNWPEDVPVATWLQRRYGVTQFQDLDLL